MLGLGIHSGEGDNLTGSPAFPFDDRIAPFDASDEENIDRHRKGKFPHGDLHIPVDHFVIRDIPHPERKVRNHTHTTPDLIPRGAFEPRFRSVVKPLNNLCLVAI